MSRTALVTGASGFIGQHLSRRLQEAGWNVIRHARADGDIATSRLDGGNIQHVFHLAARTFVPESWTNPVPFYATNVAGTANMADFCREHGASLTLLSSYVYGKPQFLPITEEHPLSAFNPYSHSKLLAEDVCRYFASQFHVRAAVVRPFNIYGPGQARTFLVPSLVAQALDPHVSEICIADDRPKRDYLFVDDFIDLLLRTADAKGFDIYNAGSGSSASPREVAELILRAAGIEKPVVSRGECRPEEVLDTVAAITKARDLLGWEPHIPLAEGLSRTIKSEVERLAC